MKNSRQVHSSQTGTHPSLERVVRRHLSSHSRRPIPTFSADAFERMRKVLDDHGGPLVLDSGCGTGVSTRRLAAVHPEALVVGLDQSAHRIGKGIVADPLPANALLLRAQAQDIWRLLVQEGVRLRAHYLLYPNPWPKPGHLQRRWHGHEAFCDLLALGGVLELRTNWPTYAEEFALALRIAGVQADDPAPFVPDDPLTPFEAKYHATGHALVRLRADLDAAR